MTLYSFLHIIDGNLFYEVAFKMFNCMLLFFRTLGLLSFPIIIVKIFKLYFQWKGQKLSSKQELE